MSRIWITVAIWCVSAGAAYAAQTAQVLDVAAPELDVLLVRVSDHDVNRFRISGARIVSAVVQKSPLVGVDKDEATGQIFLRLVRAPDGSRAKPFTMYLTDDKGRSYTLRVIPKSIPGQSVIIRPREVRRDRKRPVGVEARVGRIKRLVRAAALGDVPRRCSYEETGRRIPWWPGTRMREEARWDCGAWSVWRYRLANTGKGEMRLDERWFYHDGVVAVVADRHVVMPGEATAVYVIRAAHDE